jgi:transposase
MSDRQQVEVEEREEIVERVAAIDVAKASGMVCTRVPHAIKAGKRSTMVWQVPSTTNQILELAEQLAGEGIQRVVVESTSDYWRPFVYLLEARGLVVWLVNAHDVKHLPGRPKTDKLDAVWLAKLNERGMLRPSFVPPAQIRRLRDYTRLRADLTADRTRHKQRLEKLLEDALIKLGTVATDILGVSGRAMLEALIAGQRDPTALAELARGRLRVKHAALVEALTGRFEDHHAQLARMLLDQIDALSGQIDQLTALIEQAIAAICAATPPAPAPGPGGGTAATLHAGIALAGSVPGHPTASIPKPASCRPRPCRSWTAWTRSPGSAATPPRSSSPRLGWTWASSPPRRTWCHGPGWHPGPSSPAPSTAPAPPARATPTSRPRSGRPPPPPPRPIPSSASATAAWSGASARAEPWSLWPVPSW